MNKIKENVKKEREMDILWLKNVSQKASIVLLLEELELLANDKGKLRYAIITCQI